MTWVPVRSIAETLATHHYLGPIGRGVAWSDEFGVIVLSAPTSRRIPMSWLELSRWCIVSREKNAGSKQWARMVRSLRRMRPECTTIVSYSDPGVGHTGALYRACNWWWAPTWHRLRPPPSGNGEWKSGEASGVKDRWVFALRADPGRAAVLMANDDGLLKRFPWAAFVEGRGADYSTFKNQVLEIRQ